MGKCKICGKSMYNDVDYHFQKFHPELITDTGENTKKKVVPKKLGSKPKIIVDGNNVAYSTGNNPLVFHLKSVRAQLIKNNYDPIIIISKALVHSIDDKTELLRLIRIGWLTEADNDRDDDIEIIETAIQYKTKIISNDNFQEHKKAYSKHYDFSKVTKFSIINDKITVKLD
jgi:hypothetical protein